MAQSDRNSQRENKSRGNEPNFNWRGIVLLAGGFSCIALAMLYFRGGMQPGEEVPYNWFLELLEHKELITAYTYLLQLRVDGGRLTHSLRGACSPRGVGSRPAPW